MTLNSAGNFTIPATDSSDGGKAPDTSPAIPVSLPSGPTIVWQGDGSLNQWNTSTLNWTNTSGTPVAFADGDKVIFDDTGAASSGSVHALGNGATVEAGGHLATWRHGWGSDLRLG